MIRDPLYRDIVARLNGRLDPELFEHCVADLLRGDFPTLVPIRGGNDAGMDGAIADMEGAAYPLVCTTQQSVITNLTQSLRAYLNRGGSRRKAVVATSRLLTPIRRRNLEQRARDLGFVLVQVFDQAALANRLYASPRWCLELLGLNGAPPALSAVPCTTRPLLNIELVGRQEDLRWLRESRGKDRLLVGVPGSGKTSLAAVLVKDGRALFATDKDMGRVAAAVREMNPEEVIVDDAHLDPDYLLALRHLRDEVGAGFSIVATSWKGDLDVVATALQVPATRVRHLKSLGRGQMVEIVAHAGIQGPIELVREIVDQADGRPGLAVTLAWMCLQRSVRAVVLGDAIASATKEAFRRLVGREPTELLAAFSLGGDAGMRLADVARLFQVDLIEIRQTLARLSVGGVIKDSPEGGCVVVPRTLRHALVRDVFFGNTPLPMLDALIATAPCQHQVALSLIGAAARGASVKRTELSDLVERVDSSDVWAAFAFLGQEEAEWILDNHPGHAGDVAMAALINAPTKGIPLVLSEAVGETRAPHSYPEHPFRTLSTWAHDIDAAFGERLRRRHLLFNSAREWIAAGRDPSVGLRAVAIAMSPKLEGTSTDPGEGNTLTLKSGLLSAAELGELATMWPDAVALIRSITDPDWHSVFETLADWAYPHMAMAGGGTVPPKIQRFMKKQAGRMLGDVARLARDRPGVVSRIAKMAKKIRLPVQVEVDPVFEALFPSVDYKSFPASEHRNRQRAERLGRTWACEDLRSVCARLVHLEREAAQAGLPMWPREGPAACNTIASITKHPGRWIFALLDAGAAGDLVAPFLHRLVVKRPRTWRGIVARCISNIQTRPFAVRTVLESEQRPSEVLDTALAAVTPAVAHSACAGGKLPVGTLARLLTHDDPMVATSTAVGVWLAPPRGAVPEDLDNEWRLAVTNAECDDDYNAYWLGEILAGDGQLAFEWVRKQTAERPRRISFRRGKLFEKAVGALDDESLSGTTLVDGDASTLSEGRT